MSPTTPTGLAALIAAGPKAAPVDAPLVRPFIIAEAGVNHEGDLDLAYRLIEEAAAAGAQAIKFQTYRAEALASRDSPAYWDRTLEPTGSQYELFKRYDSFGRSEFEAMATRCGEVGIEFLSTPFDIDSARMLDDLMGVVKVSSSDMNNRPFVDFLCSLGKPIVLSTGAAWMWEVEQTVSWVRAHGNPLAILHCVLSYPAADADANLAVIPELARRFPRDVIGYSDHTLPGDMRVVELATLLGARIVEKHFTHDKTLPGNDHYHAMDARDLARLTQRFDELAALLGSGERAPLDCEADPRRYARRSLVAARDVAAGATLTAADLTCKRPGTGIDPRDHAVVVGSVARDAIAEDTVLTWDLLDRRDPPA